MLRKTINEQLFANGRWLTAKYHSTCSCGHHISPGDDLWFVPYKKPQCSTCGHKDYPQGLKDLLGITY